MRFEAVLFDLDGTLFDTKRLYLECYRRALAPVLGREPTDAEILALRPRSEVRFLLEHLAADPHGEDRREACFGLFYDAYERLHADYFDGVYDGVADLIATLRARRVRVGIVSGKSRRSWAITLAHLTLGDFDALVLDDDVAEPKPHPEGLDRALAMLGVAPAAAAYVGDTMGDVAAAQAAGVTPIAAAWARR
ncbi:MAG: HAD family hydrolase, partial [Longimicrobiales bacterium]